MTTSQRDTKILWGRSGNRCAICRRELTQDSTLASKSFPLGEHSHIVAETTAGPRGVSPLDQAERDGYPNLILLCPTDHSIVDKNVADWPVERLYLKKAEHELWVQSTLADSLPESDPQKQAAYAIYTTMIDTAVAASLLEKWESWATKALAPIPQWPIDSPERIFEFTRQVVVAIWPGMNEELERAIRTFSATLQVALNHFMENAETRGNMLSAHQFYKVHEPDQAELAYKLREEWAAWCDKGIKLVLEATKAANWFADVVRRDINPMFFATHGRFSITYGPLQDLTYEIHCAQYTPEERSALPDAFVASHLKT